MLIKIYPSGFCISKHSCSEESRKGIEKYLKSQADKNYICLKITDTDYHIESIQRTLYEILYSLSINYGIELM